MGREIPGGIGLKLAAPRPRGLRDGGRRLVPDGAGRPRDGRGGGRQDHHRALGQPGLRLDRIAVALGRLVHRCARGIPARGGTYERATRESGGGMSELLVHAAPAPDPEGRLLSVTPDSAGWSHVGFEVVELAPGQVTERHSGERELCLVVVAGSCHVRSEHGDWTDLGRRPDPFAGLPDDAYLPPGTGFVLEGAGDGAELGLCYAPAREGADPRVLPADEVEVEVRGHGSLERFIHPILMEDRAAEALLVCEVLTPPGHWSSYPPH